MSPHCSRRSPGPPRGVAGRPLGIASGAGRRLRLSGRSLRPQNPCRAEAGNSLQPLEGSLPTVCPACRFSVRCLFAVCHSRCKWKGKQSKAKQSKEMESKAKKWKGKQRNGKESKETASKTKKGKERKGKERKGKEGTERKGHHFDSAFTSFWDGFGVVMRAFWIIWIILGSG